jgi:hypothetical protein
MVLAHSQNDASELEWRYIRTRPLDGRFDRQLGPSRAFFPDGLDDVVQVHHVRLIVNDA